MDSKRIKEIQEQTPYPQSVSVMVALNQVWNECQQERSYSEEDMKFAYEQGARLALLSQTDLALHKGEFPNPEEWFNQFKSK